MQDNHEILDNSQSKLRQDELNNSFSDLEDFNQDVPPEEHTVKIDISDQPHNSCETLIKHDLQDIVAQQLASQTISIRPHLLSRNNEDLCHLSKQVFEKDQQKIQIMDSKAGQKQQDKIQEEHIQRIKLIYSQSFLGSKKITLSQIKKLKVFLFVPKHGQELVRWGNQKFGTQHTVISALERLEYLQDSECSQFTVKMKQNLKYFLLLCLCMVIIKVFL